MKNHGLVGETEGILLAFAASNPEFNVSLLTSLIGFSGIARGSSLIGISLHRLFYFILKSLGNEEQEVGKISDVGVWGGGIRG